MTKSVIPPSPSTSEYKRNALYKAVMKANQSPMFERNDPIALFSEWLEEAKLKEENDPNAMALATVDESGLPDVRMVLLKGLDERGFVFYSHKNSAKGLQLRANNKAALNFHWKSLRRQVRIRGEVTMASKAEIGSYFSTRARDSQIGAWASKQSKPMKNRGVFEKTMDELKTKFEGASVPLPPGWKGWRVEPTQIEFWRDKPFRLHDRLVFEREQTTDAWKTHRLYP